MRTTCLLAATLLIVGADSAVFGADAPTPADAETPDIVVETSPFKAVTLVERLQWYGGQTFGVANLGGSIPGAAWTTMFDKPREAGSHWSGFGERYGVSLSTNAVSNTMEAGVGAIWGEDPRYIRVGPVVPVTARFRRILKWTVLAQDRNGEMRPAYARFIAYTASSYASNAWREPSDTSSASSLGRVGFALLGRVGSNAFNEFWPDAKRKFLHRINN